MKYGNSMLVVKDMEASKAFYRQVLGLHVTADLGANVILTGGLSLQTLESWAGFIQKDPAEIHFGGQADEQYFEEENFDAFLEKLAALPGIRYVHPVQEFPWGQRGVRFYDPDGHIIEVGESLKTVCRRFLDSGMTLEQIAQRMDVPLRMVKSLAR
ncbi:VOC family protein [Allofournierella sp.]|uniref:VOC family protein n=1 Tax=Allofournierella sp. TaxID=1940256 RepID=UPI003AB7FE8C